MCRSEPEQHGGSGRRAPQLRWRDSSRSRRGHLVPYAGLNLIRFNGIRNFPISAFASRHPTRTPSSLIKTLGEHHGNGETSRPFGHLPGPPSLAPRRTRALTPDSCPLSLAHQFIQDGPNMRAAQTPLARRGHPHCRRGLGARDRPPPARPIWSASTSKPSTTTPTWLQLAHSSAPARKWCHRHAPACCPTSAPAPS